MVKTHRLAPMLDARSMAVAGASERPGSFGQRLAQSVLSAGFKGRVDFINPRATSILERPCHASFRDIDEAPDLAILGVGAQNLERALIDAIECGARSAVIFDACHGEAAGGGSLLQRLRDIAREAYIPVCGGAGMGVINVRTGSVASFYGAGHLKPGGISLIAHSGSVFTTLAMNDPRFRFDLLVSQGQEIGATIDEYISYAIHRPSTKAIAVFMEAARNPQGFMDSLRQAQEAGVPVIVCKVGRSEESAKMARSHTGALTGSNAAYDAAIAECGAIAVDNVDQLMNVALLCGTGRVPGPGGIGLVTDSGGLRELAMDLGAESGAPLAVLSQDTKERLRAVLPATLEPSNPLDCAADLTDNFAKVFEDGVDVLASADEVSMVGLEADLRDDYVYDMRLKDLAMNLSRRISKPCFFYSSFANTHNRSLGETLTENDVPCINGVSQMFEAASRFQAWADRRMAKSENKPIAYPEAKLNTWKTKLAKMDIVDELAGLRMLQAFGIPATAGSIHDTPQSLVGAANQLGYPLVLKTAERGIDHKSDAGGVFLNLTDETALLAAYEIVSAKLGSRVILQPMATKGVELAFGYVRDPDFGPLVMVSAGGLLVENFASRAFALAPISEQQALAMINRLPVANLLDGVRGAKPSDKAGAASALCAFSVMCAGLKDSLSELDVNPVIVSPSGVVAVDALVVLDTKVQI